MQIITTVSQIAEQLKPLLKVIPSRPTHAVLANIKCEAVQAYKPCPGAITEDGLLLSAADLSSFLTVFIPCQVLEVGNVCIPAFVFGKIIESLNGKGKGKKNNVVEKSLILSTTVDEYDQLLLNFEVEQNKQTLVCRSSEAFIDFPTVTDDVVLRVNGLESLTACKTLVKHVRKNDLVHPHLSGIHLVDGRLIACDGHKIAYKLVQVSGDNQPPIIIKPEFIEHSIRLGLLKEVQGAEFTTLLDLKIEKDGWIQLQTANFCLTTRLEVYVPIPDIQVGKTDYLQTEVNRTELIKKVELAQLCNSEEYLDKDLNPVWLKLDNYGLHVVGAMSTDLIEPLINQRIYEPATALIDAKKFIAMLKSVTTKTVVLNVPQENPNLMGIESDGVSIGLLEVRRLNKESEVVADGLGWKRPNQLPYSWKQNDLVGYYMDVHCNSFGFRTAEAMPYRFETLAGLVDIPMLRVTEDAIAYGFAKAETLPHTEKIIKRKPELDDTYLWDCIDSINEEITRLRSLTPSQKLPTDSDMIKQLENRITQYKLAQKVLVASNQ